MVFCKEEAKTA